MAKGLGKGLSALIADKNVGEAIVEAVADSGHRQTLPVEKLGQSKLQPRQFFDQDELGELAESIRKNGVIQPVIVRKASTRGNYEIIAGERRWRAAKIAGLDVIPAIVMDLDDRTALEIALVENVQRQNLQPLEEAEGYNRLMDEFAYTQEELATVIGKSRSQIANTVRLLALPDKVKKLLTNGKLSMGHARVLVGCEQAEEAAKEIVKKDLNVRQSEKLVKRLAAFPEEQRAKMAAQKDPELKALEKELSRKLGLKLTITNKDEKGRVIIAYHSLAELDEILRRLEAKG